MLSPTKRLLIQCWPFPSFSQSTNIECFYPILVEFNRNNISVFIHYNSTFKAFLFLACHNVHIISLVGIRTPEHDSIFICKCNHMGILLISINKVTVGKHQEYLTEYLRIVITCKFLINDFSGR